MICIRRRSRRSAVRSSAKTSTPSNVASPPVGSCSRRMVRPTEDLPHPLSPTSASVSPRPTSNETPSTARTGGAPRAKRPLRGVVLDEVAHLEQGRHRHLALGQPAAHAVVRPHRQQLGRELTLLERLRAARPEPAAGRPRGGRRHGAADRRQPLHRPGDARNRGEQSLGVGMRRVVRTGQPSSPLRRSAPRTSPPPGRPGPPRCRDRG